MPRRFPLRSEGGTNGARDQLRTKPRVLIPDRMDPVEADRVRRSIGAQRHKKILDELNNAYTDDDVGVVRNITATAPVDLDALSGQLTGDQLTLAERSTDPSDPSEGNMVIWLSDGTASGDDGDLMIKITAGGVTKTATIIDFSAV